MIVLSCYELWRGRSLGGTGLHPVLNASSVTCILGVCGLKIVQNIPVRDDCISRELPPVVGSKSKQNGKANNNQRPIPETCKEERREVGWLSIRQKILCATLTLDGPQMVRVSTQGETFSQMVLW